MVEGFFLISFPQSNMYSGLFGLFLCCFKNSRMLNGGFFPLIFAEEAISGRCAMRASSRANAFLGTLTAYFLETTSDNGPGQYFLASFFSNLFNGKNFSTWRMSDAISVNFASFRFFICKIFFTTFALSKIPPMAYAVSVGYTITPPLFNIFLMSASIFFGNALLWMVINFIKANF